MSTFFTAVTIQGSRKSVSLLSAILLIYLIYCAAPYPSPLIDSLRGDFNPFGGDRLFSQISKDFVTGIIAAGLLLDLFMTGSCHRSAVWGASIFLACLISASVMTMANPIGAEVLRSFLGIRGLSHFFVPLILGLSLKDIAQNNRLWAMALTFALLICIVHTTLINLGIGRSPYFNYSSTISRSIGLYAEPNLMAFSMSLIAIFFFRTRRYIRCLMAIALVISCLSITGTTPLLFYPLMKKGGGRRFGGLIVCLLFVVIFLLPRTLAYLAGAESSANGKFLAFQKTREFLSKSSTAEIFFGHGYSIVDSAGFFLHQKGMNPQYFSSESSYSAILIQFGAVPLLLLVSSVVWALIRLRRNQESTSIWLRLILSSISVSNFGLLYLSIFPVISVYGLTLGLAYNPRILTKIKNNI